MASNKAVNNREIAENVLKAVGGAENVTNATHCMTRLRLNLKDDSIPKDDEVKAIDGVLGVVRSGGQYQVVIGQNVPKVYAEVCNIGGFATKAAVDENLDKPKEKLTPKAIGMNILNYLAGSLTPLIPILIGAAMFKTVLSILGPDLLGIFSEDSDLYTLHNELSREQQKLLLRFLDAEEHFRDEEMIDAFVSGFKLADGIRRELGEAYSYEAEDEARAQEIFRREQEQSE